MMPTVLVLVVLEVVLMITSGSTSDDKVGIQDWYGAIREQAITWANIGPDICHIMASLNQNEFDKYFL